MSKAPLARASSGPQTPDDAADIDIGDIFFALRKRWRLLPLCLAVTLAVAGAYVLLAPKRFGAAMSFMVDTRARAPVGSDATPAQQSVDVGLVENQMRFLQSNKVLLRVVENEQLQSDPDFTGGGFSLSRLFGAASGRPSDIQIAEALAKAITIKRAEKSYVIDVEITASAAEKAERLARALSKAYLDASAELRDSIENQETKWLDDRIDSLRRRLEAAEARVQAYRAAKSIVVTSGHTPTEEQLKEADAALVVARGKRSEAEAAYKQFLAGARAGPTETTRSQLMDRLRAEYATLARDAAQQQATLGPRHPAYIALQNQLAAHRAQIDRESRNIKDTLRRALDGARDVERQAEDQVTRLKKTITDSGDNRIELNELERRAESLRDNYQKSLAARESTRREIFSSPNPVLINQPLALQGRVSPKTLPALVIALAGGINLWIVAALLAEYATRRRARAGEAQAQGQGQDEYDDHDAAEPRRRAPAAERFPLPDFGAAGDGLDGDTLACAMDAVESPGSAWREAIERIHARLGEPSDDGPLIVAVSGRRHGAGTTTLALSLALAACEAGEQVLIVDVDRTRPALSKMRPHLAPVGRPDDRAPQFFSCRRDRDSGGSLALAIDDADAAFLTGPWIDRFDLVVLDCGAGAADVDESAVDAQLVAERARDRRWRATLTDMGERDSVDAGRGTRMRTRASA